jgi:hypothetical protein
MLEKKVGPCRMATDNIKYYFDPKMKKCLPFNYGKKFYDLIYLQQAYFNEVIKLKVGVVVMRIILMIRKNANVFVILC